MTPPCPITAGVFEDETIFITGCSGFLGKVILEKLVRSFKCRRIYALLRSRRGKLADDRFESEIVQSRIFDRLRAERGDHNFSAWIRTIVTPISGDLLNSHRIGISSSDYDLLTSSVSVIIHSAASVEFDLPIQEATKINIDGSLAVLDLAKLCPHLKSYVHVSTCYVNSHLGGTIEERMYTPPFDVEEMYAMIKRQSAEELVANKHSITYGWPNTYAFTKFLGEHLLARRRGNVPVVICRPSIIAAALAEPVPGWTDSISAATAVFLAVGMGICPVLPGSEWNVLDMVPVDTCSGMIILTAARMLVNGEPDFPCAAGMLPAVHCSTSATSDPMTISVALDVLGPYFSTHRPAKTVGPSRLEILSNPVFFELQKWIKLSLPVTIAGALETVTGGPRKGWVVSDMKRALSNGNRVIEVFSFFTTNEWIFESEFAAQQPTASPLFPLIDRINTIDWTEYIHLVCYGMRRFCLRDELAELPRAASVGQDALQRAKLWRRELRGDTGRSWWSSVVDLKWIKEGVQMDYSPLCYDHIVANVLKHPDVVKQIQGGEEGRRVLEGIACRFDHNSTRFFGATLHTLFSSIFDRVSVNDEFFPELRALMAKGPVLLLPTHRSYLDFLMLSYVLFQYHIKVPYIVAGDDFQKIPGVNALLRRTGAFFMKRKLDTVADPLYVAVFKAYFQQVILDHGMVEFFPEGTRSRTGTTLHHKAGLLSFATDLVLEKRVDDIAIVPVTISYERVLEAESYSPELMGRPKSKESLARVIKAGATVFKTNHGRAHVVFGKPTGIKEWTSASSSRFETVQKIGNYVTTELNKGLVVSVTHLVAAVVLANRHAGLKVESLWNQVELVRDTLVKQFGPGTVDLPISGTCKHTVNTCIATHFKDLLEVKKSVVTLKETNKQDNTLLLAMYRNQLLGLVGTEGLVGLVLESGSRDGVHRGTLVEQMMSSGACMGLPLNVDKDKADEAIERMQKMELIAISSDGLVNVCGSGKPVVDLLVSLVYPIAVAVRFTLLSAKQLENRNFKSVDEMAKEVQPMLIGWFDRGVVMGIESCTIVAVKLALHSLVKCGAMTKNGSLTPSHEVVIRQLSSFIKIHEQAYARL